MRGRVIWRVRAEADLSEAYLYIGADSPESAERLLDAVEAAVALLLQNPLAGSPREFPSSRALSIRSWTPHGFPNHLVFYAIRGANIEIIRFLNAARDLPRVLDDE